MSNMDIAQWILIMAHSILIMLCSFDIDEIKKQLRGGK